LLNYIVKYFCFCTHALFVFTLCLLVVLTCPPSCNVTERRLDKKIFCSLCSYVHPLTIVCVYHPPLFIDYQLHFQTLHAIQSTHALRDGAVRPPLASSPSVLAMLPLSSPPQPAVACSLLTRFDSDRSPPSMYEQRPSNPAHHFTDLI
jgi:hypothetical protein